VWVVDNASTDGTQDMLRNDYPQVHLIENNHNPGFAAANNQALAMIDTDYVILLNPDTVIEPGALNTLVAYLDDHPQVAAAGPRLLNHDGTLQISCYVFPTLFREFLRLSHLDHIWSGVSYRMDRWDLNLPRQVEVIQGACMILRKAALDQVGLFDERFFIYTEEVDLCYRLRQAGWQIHWVPQAEVIHLGGQSTSQVAQEMFIHLYQSKHQFIQKHYGWLAALTYKLVLFITSMPRLLLIPLGWIGLIPANKRLSNLGANYLRLLTLLPRMK
jgi:N-acetylglucosaminyl-diphospho-decaprenol L-rhamnosyltransferase